MINLNELRESIRNMKPRSRLQRLLKEELTSLGHWRNLPRGNPEKGFKAMKEKK